MSGSVEIVPSVLDCIRKTPESDGHQGRDEPDVSWWRLTGARSPSSELRPPNQECFEAAKE
jgi:hypothetical protein